MSGLAGRIIALALLGMAAAGCQTPEMGGMPSDGSFMSSNSEVAPPAGFISFCLRNPDQCTAPADQAQTVQLDEHNWQTLQFVNEEVNRTVRFEDDSVHYGRAEYWTLAVDGHGDCDDYALTKRKELIDAGFPEKALRVAVVRTWNNVGHAVLTVATDRGDYVLDNLTWEILPWNEARYIWISRQDGDNPMGWVSLQTTAAARAPARSITTLASTR